MKPRHVFSHYSRFFFLHMSNPSRKDERPPLDALGGYEASSEDLAIHDEQYRLEMDKLTAIVGKLVEEFADYMHRKWTNWYTYQHDHGNEIETALRWELQARTLYKDLSEDDKEKDRKFAREIIAIFEKECGELSTLLI